MSKKLDLTNKRFGKLVALQSMDSQYGKSAWKCICDCGKEHVALSTNLVSGHCCSCGCIKKPNLVGQQFGSFIVKLFFCKKNGQRIWELQCYKCGNIKYLATQYLKDKHSISCKCMSNVNSNMIGTTVGFLTVLSFSHSSKKGRIWKTQCKCGKIRYINTATLNKSKYPSCGCYNPRPSQAFNLLGQNFGKLTVLQRMGHNKWGQILWKCICKCGKVKLISSNGLMSGDNVSCGSCGRKLRNDLTGKNIGIFYVEKCLGSQYINKCNRIIYLCKCNKCGSKVLIRQDYINKLTSCGNCKLYKNGVRCSYKQQQLCVLWGKGVLNFKTKSNKYIDIAFVDNGRKLGIEYDCIYWHDQINFKRHQILEKDGWKILYIVTNNLLPTKKKLDEAVNRLKESKDSYIVMYLEDIK